MSTDKIIIGIDLAWKVGRKSFGVMVSEDLSIQSTFSFYDLEQLENTLDSHGKILHNIFIDAPLHLNTREKFRSCDRAFMSRGYPILPFNKKILRQRYLPYTGFLVRSFLESRGCKYCGNFNEPSLFEVYAFGNAMVVFGIKSKKQFLKNWKNLLKEFGFMNLNLLKSTHEIDALLCTLPYFTETREFGVFTKFVKSGYCLFVPMRGRDV